MEFKKNISLIDFSLLLHPQIFSIKYKCKTIYIIQTPL